MKLYIPEIGDEIRLTADWTFDLYNEHRNETMMIVSKDPRKAVGDYHKTYGTIPCTVPTGAVLKIDRIYIRKGLNEYSSITFMWKGMRVESQMEEIFSYGLLNNSSPAKWGEIPTGRFSKKPARPVRFWAKLSDVNNIEFEPA